ncbi:uncharacterized protein PGTG_22123 [Puccinia graminis f. sp. tritici CRL 75-36-700-3]|uniref:E3 ubiquitin-protein ligase rbbp6 n=1 Tax=Puccinia graminis f. sp. tritici (strain CRL 75-36-700-3 / race SCCL) TaxID=418459 RepID=H6QTL2_PUCGT|nr:uncharacterized protein PGTG_22123 [Puccinia graminis f. sp. tritici CRL 75-36-700-3]EHS64227.1 hypothetical protein PGTG_22123 [Puccinia graminis f. sp. tritici CRL 75-36-700-3]
MSGHVYYRFKSQKEFQRIIFEGIGISVWDLKREIIQESKMGKGTDFDFAIYNADTDEEYANDHAIIPRSSSVIARRLPPKRPGHGNAQQYVGVNLTGSNSRTNPPLTAHVDWRGGGAISKDFRNRVQSPSNTPPTSTVTPVLTGGERDSEAESMAAMFAAQDQQWQKTQETMATATRVGRNMSFRDRGGGQHRLNKARENGSHNGPSGPGSSTNPNSATSNINSHNGQGQLHSQAPPPQGYICYRCGQKGHWIQACPTNDNPDFEGRPRIKRTTGIPKSFLQKVESGKPVDGQNVMVTSDGSFVIAKPDNATWKQHKSVVVKNLSAADIENQRPSDPDLVCSICSKLLKNSVKMICCSSSFCESCISNYLKSHSSVCPECETKVSFNPASSSSSSSTNPPNNNKAFIIDDERRKRSDDYIQEILKISQAAQLEQVKSNEDQTAAETASKSGPEAQETPSDSKQEDEPDHQATKPEETSPSDPATAGTPQVAQPKDDSKATSAEKSDQSNANPSSGKEAPQVTISTEVAKLSPTEAKNTRSAGPGSAGASHTPNMMNGMMEFGNKEFGRFGLGPGMALNGAGGNMPMMHGMGMNGMGMGYMGNGMMMGKMMEPMMMNGMGGAGHNVVMNSNQIGFGGPMHAGNGMAMELGNGAGPEAMLGVQLNQVMMMLQNPQLSEPIRMQLLMQQQNLQQQLAMVQQMGAGVGPVNHMMDHGMMNNMHMAAGNGMLMNHPFGNSLGVHHRQQQQDFNQNTSFGPFGMANFGGAHPLGFPSNGLHGHHPNQVGGGLGMKQVNQIPQFNQHQKHPHPNLSSNFQRPVGNHHNHLNAYNRRPPHHLNNPQTPHPLNQPNQHLAAHSNSHRDNPKRKRPEDLIELESGEKVPRYM